ncbi:MAG: thiol-disulfide oxidoreductase DCC family protein [Candidatus Limnocylindria bacterium]
MSQPAAPLTVAYDAECALCRSAARRLETLDRHQRVTLVPIRDMALGDQPTDAPRPGELAGALLVVRPDGSWLSGGQAVLEIAANVPLLRPIAALGRLPFVNRLVDPLYRLVARHRHRLSRVI